MVSLKVGTLVVPCDRDLVVLDHDDLVAGLGIGQPSLEVLLLMEAGGGLFLGWWSELVGSLEQRASRSERDAGEGVLPVELVGQVLGGSLCFGGRGQSSEEEATKRSRVRIEAT